MDELEARIARLETLYQVDKELHIDLQVQVKELHAEVKKLNAMLSRFRGVWLGVALSAAVVTYFVTQGLDFIKGKL